MFSDNNRISTRQVFRLFVFDFIGMSTLVLPGVLAQMTGCDGLFAILLGHYHPVYGHHRRIHCQHFR